MRSSSDEPQKIVEVNIIKAYSSKKFKKYSLCWQYDKVNYTLSIYTIGITRKQMI